MGRSWLNAFREVEDNLAAERYQLQRIKHLESQVEYAGDASNQLRDQYLIGDAEYLDVLSAITGQQSLQRQLLSARLELVLIRVGLYLALAGDFDPCQQPTIDRLPRTEDEPLETPASQDKPSSESQKIEKLPPVQTEDSIERTMNVTELERPQLNSQNSVPNANVSSNSMDNAGPPDSANTEY